MKSVCDTLSSLQKPEDTMRIAQQMWDRTQIDSELREDRSFTADIADHALHAFAVLRRINPLWPEPGDLPAWKLATYSLDTGQ
jgi:hypothetical protein